MIGALKHFVLRLGEDRRTRQKIEDDIWRVLLKHTRIRITQVSEVKPCLSQGPKLPNDLLDV